MDARLAFPKAHAIYPNRRIRAWFEKLDPSLAEDPKDVLTLKDHNEGFLE